MPYRIARLSSCPPDRPYAVVLISDNSILGCHADMTSGERQIAAIEISERTEAEKQQPTSSAVHVNTIMNPKKRKPKYAPSVLLKGDYVGHPFRGNQWTDSSGISRGLASGSASDGDRVDLRGVATIEEARRTGRPLAMLQPENFSAGVQAALRARFEANGIIKNLLNGVPTEETGAIASDPRFIVADYVSKLVFYEVFKQISRDYALALGFTEVTGEEAEKAKFENYAYEHLGRNEDGRLTREERTVNPRDMTGERNAADERGSVVWRDGSGKLQFWFVGEEQPPEFTERYGEKSSFEGIDLRSLADPSSIDPDSSFKIDSEESGAQLGPKAVAFANQEMQKRMRALGIGMPELQPFARLSGKALEEKLRADGDTSPKETIGRLIDHVQNVAKKSAFSYAAMDGYPKFRGHNIDGSEDFQIETQIEDVTPDAKISVTIPANKMSAILKDGRLKTQFETQRSGGANMPTWREDWEAVMFGFPIGSNLSVRPIYGMVETGGVQPSSLRGNEQYGTVTLVLKDSVRDRTTFTNGDSLNLNPFHAPVNDPSIRPANRNSATSLAYREEFKETRAKDPRNRGYYEAQIHGGVQVSDIERVVIDTSTYKDFEQQEVQPSPALIKALTKAGLPFEIVQGKPPTQPKVDKALFNPFVLIKGDYVGHPFRGNQWTDSSGVSRSPTSAPEDTSSKPSNVGGRPMIRHSAGRYESAEGLQFVKGSPPTAHWDVYRSENDYDPLYESGRGSLQEAMKDFDDFRDANTQKALVDARDADLSVLHTEREVKIVEDTSNRYGVGTRFENKIFLGGVPTTLGTKTNKIIHSSKQRAEKAQKKVVAEMEEILADPTLQVKALEENLWEYTYNYKIGDRVARATSRARFDKPLPETESEQVTKFETSAWQRKAGKNPKGGLNAAGRAAYNRETGGNLKPPVKSGDNPRRASFLARMGNNAGPERDENGEPTRLLLSLQAWGAESKADARAKAKAISARNANKVNKFAFGFLKGDFVGHPFRGNQWTVGGVKHVVGPRTADEIVTRADLIKFAEMPPAFVGDTELFTHATMSRADRESMLVEGIKPKHELGTVYASRPPLVRDLGVGYVIFKADKGVAVEGKDIVEIGLSYDEYKFNKTIHPSNIVKVVGTYVFNDGGQNIREDYLADFILKNPDDPQIDALPEKYRRWATLASDVSKGDFVGHPFRGNQWTDSSGVSQGGVASSFNQDRLRSDGAITLKPVIKPKVLIKPNVLTSNNVTRQIDDLLSKNKIMEDASTKFNADYYGDYLQQVKNLGYEVTSRHNVILDGVETDLSDISRTRPDHPIGKLRAEYDRSEAQRRDAYFTAVNSVFYSSFDLPDGQNVYDAAVKLTGEKVYTGIYRAGGGDHVQQIIDLSVRSEKDHKTQERFVFDEGCTGPSGIGKGATGVNKALREGRVTPFARAVDASMLITNQPLAGYRGASLPRSIIDKLVVGSTYKEKGFMSVAPQRSTATFYAKVRNEHVGADSRVVIFRMLMPEGIKADPMRRDEIVVARNSTVRVAAVREVKDPELGAILEVDAVVEQ